MSAISSASVQASTRPAPPRPLDEAIRTIPKAWFRPVPAVYWIDFLMAAGLGWAFFAVGAGMAGWPRVLWLMAAAAALYRAVLFIHEITHLSARDVPGFTPAWNALVGVPLLIPSFLYEGVHTDHHRQRCYGTRLDPEYVPYAQRSSALIAGSIAASPLVPVLFVVRFGVLAPLGWALPPLRRAIDAHASALVINRHYIRRAPIGFSGRIQELAAAIWLWTATAAWWWGWLPTVFVWSWLAVGAAISLVNAVRTLAAHRYELETEAVTMTEQLLDSCTVSPTTTSGTVARAIRDGLHEVVAPVGLRYHALHHWIPSLPYHNLGRVHRQLTASLQPDAPYRATEEPHLAAALRVLLTKASRRGR